MGDRRSIVIDTDPGIDDAVALLLALAAPDALDLRAVTTVAGNVPLPLTTRNARAIVELSGRRDVPVHAGCAAPLERPLWTAEDVHGRTGMDGADLPEPELALSGEPAVDALVRIVSEAPPGAVTLCPIGPLTNIATALARAPALAGRIREIVLMGGAVGLGNITPAAEFNVYVDPHAAAAVFAAGVPIVMFPLDVTHQVLVTPDWVEAARALGTRTGRALAGMLAAGVARVRPRLGKAAAPLHDPCVIAWLLWPELFTGTPCHVAVETRSELNMGRTVVDRWARTGQPPNALVMESADGARVLARILDRLRALP